MRVQVCFCQDAQIVSLWYLLLDEYTQNHQLTGNQWRSVFYRFSCLVFIIRKMLLK